MIKHVVVSLFAAGFVGVLAGCAVDASERSGSEQQEARARFCPMIYAPVCGKDGNTYSNECFAGGPQHVAYEGECTNPCAAVLCMSGTRCEVRGKRPVCVPDQNDPCATVRCADGYHCEAVQVQCITTPCNPVAECKPTFCSSPSGCGPALGMPVTLCPDGINSSGPTGNCLQYASGCGWEIASCP